jgi:hypothetical protein
MGNSFLGLISIEQLNLLCLLSLLIGGVVIGVSSLIRDRRTKERSNGRPYTLAAKHRANPHAQ